MSGTSHNEPDSLDVAIIGMSGRFPQAPDVDTFWANLCQGRHAMRKFSDEELQEGGVPEALRTAKNFVPVAAGLEDIEHFDAAYFGFSPREAAVMDPQHRILLQCAVHALDSAAIDPTRTNALIGVYAGGGAPGYLVNHVLPNRDALAQLGSKQVEIANINDFLASRISYKLGAEGPSVTVQTACSTSLVSVVYACQDLLSFQCDVALAGGVAIDVANRFGYFHQDDGLFARDGLCRAYDASATGTVGGSGAGLVVLKRLEDALADGDRVHAVVKGFAVNNDGSGRMGFTAPSREGQAMVITTSLAAGGIDPCTVGYVEGHGTGTALGDPIELNALMDAYRVDGAAPRSTALGSVKTNIGHLDAASGVAGLIKAALCVEHGQIPPTLHYDTPTPKAPLDDGPFFVNTSLIDWPQDRGPRRAAISSFGLGGTNAHVVLEEPPAPTSANGVTGSAGPDSVDDGRQLLVWSAASAISLEAMTERIRDHLGTSGDQSLADVAWTSQVGRRAHRHRAAMVASTVTDAANVLADDDVGRLRVGNTGSLAPRIGFLLTGFGEQYPNLGRTLYHFHKAYADALNECDSILGADLPGGLLGSLFDDDAPTGPDRAGPSLHRLFADPGGDHLVDDIVHGYVVTFAHQYAMAQLLETVGIRPDVLIGSSLGEHVAACLSGVFSLSDGLRLTLERARLMADAPTGSMLAVPLSEQEAARYVDDDVSIAVVLGPHAVVLSGRSMPINTVANDLEAQAVAFRRVSNRWGFHSSLVDGILDPYRQLIDEVELTAPRQPFVSNVTGHWITDEQATSRSYWSEHLRRTVRLGDGLETLWQTPDLIMAELGPGNSLVSAALQHPAAREAERRVVVATTPGRIDVGSDDAMFLDALAHMWTAGVELDWTEIHHGRPRKKVTLPPYPFEQTRYWLDPPPEGHQPASSGDQRLDPTRWLSVPSWSQGPVLSSDFDVDTDHWLVLEDGAGVGAALSRRLTAAGASVVSVHKGQGWVADEDARSVTLDPADPSQYQRLLNWIGTNPPSRVVALWPLDSEVPPSPAATVAGSFAPIVHLIQACGGTADPALQRWDLVTSDAVTVTGSEDVDPWGATVQGVLRVAPQEFPGMRCRQVDLGGQLVADPDRAADRLLAELGHDDGPVIAHRGNYRWSPRFESVSTAATPPPFRPGGVYLITGGLGNIGRCLARRLVEQGAAKLALVGRRSLVDEAGTNGDDDHQSRGTFVAELERLGAEVLVIKADVADEDDLSEAVRFTRARLGPIDGVVHAAGTVGRQAHCSLDDIEAEQIAAHFGPKVAGVINLHRALVDERPDFVLLCSSVAAVIGGIGFGSYAAANAFMDSFACQRQQEGDNWISVDWEAWRFPDYEDLSAGVGAEIQEFALLPAEGAATFERILTTPHAGQIIVSTSDITRRSARWADPTQVSVAIERHPRPALSNAVVPPRDDLERRIATVWEELLGVDQIGVNDNFFELGGSSLVGIQVVHQLRKRLERALPLTVVYEGPTVAALADLLRDDEPSITDQPNGENR